MQSKTTLKSIAGILQKSLTVLALFCLFTGKINAQVYVNGNLSTGATSSDGTPAPGGYTWSEVQTGNNVAGYSASVAAGSFVADDFNVTCGTWDLTKFSVYSYSTGYGGATSPVVELRFAIFDTDPSVGTPTPIYGDLTTNRLTNSVNANMYRIFTGTPGTTRRIWKSEATITGLSLPPGHYWVQWQVGVQAALTSNFSPASTVAGSTSQAGNNALQYTAADGWAPLLDGPNADEPQDMPFIIDFNTTACSGTPDPGATVSSDPAVCPATPFTLSVANGTCGSGVSYQWQSSATGAPGSFSNIGGATNATLTTSITASTYYQLIVTCANTSSTGTSTPLQVTLLPSNQCYCIPGSSDCTDGDIITNVTLNQLNNTSDCEPDGYISYTADPNVAIADVVLGIANPVAVTAGGGQFDESVAIWIDYDHSGSFDASEYSYIGTTTGGTLNANINVPSTAVLGQTRMRVRVQFLNDFGPTDACTDAFIGYGETEDYTVNIIPCVQGAFTTQPTDVTTTCGSSVTLSANTVGTLLTYQWQEQAGTGAPWTNLANSTSYSGVNTTSLTIAFVTAANTGYRYRLLMSGGCTAIDFSDIVSLTVNPQVINVDPASYTTCNPIPAGSPVQLSITTTPPGILYSTDSYSSGTINLLVPDVADGVGVTSSITVPPLPAGAVVTGAAVTLNATHTYAGDLIIALKAPNGQVLSLDYAMNATGGPGATTVGLVNTVISSTGTVFLDAGTEPWTGTFAPDAYTTVPPGFPPSCASSLLASGVCTASSFADLYSVPDGTWTIGLYDYATPDEGSLTDWTLSLTYTTTSTAPYTGIWSPTTGLFTDAAGTIPYTGGAATTVYAAPTLPTVYTVTVSDPVCPPDPVLVPVNVYSPDRAISITANPYQNIYPGLRTELKANVTPDPSSTATYQWFYQGEAIPGANSNTYEANFGNYGIGDYSVDLIDPNMCSGRVSANINIGDSASTTLFIWPNPSSGVFQVRYNDGGINDIRTKAPYLQVYDATGRRLFSKTFNQLAPYQRMDVDLSKEPKGTYIVVLYDNSGKMIKSGRVVIR